MPDNKLTDVPENNVVKMSDNEIIKAYEFCLKNQNCIGCIADKNSKSGEFDCKLKPQDIIDVFNRLQAENEKNKNIIRLADKTIETANAEIEQLKEKSHPTVVAKQTENINITQIKAEAYKEVLNKVRILRNQSLINKAAANRIEKILIEMAGE